MTTCGFPSILEPPGSLHGDGMTPTPWGIRLALVWDAIVVDTFPIEQKYRQKLLRKSLKIRNVMGYSSDFFDFLWIELNCIFSPILLLCVCHAYIIAAMLYHGVLCHNKFQIIFMFIISLFRQTWYGLTKHNNVCATKTCFSLTFNVYNVEKFPSV